eukprot:CAMPEP_0174323572 /NCGR_PEP_ID=MMETSP0810-20121108/11902_1 /TAXON_ID=73025 ORGANISM="Eutreptiella gymnastica-like, Strain CCMP1594" /NCGR_SAMPLE_ID=MMETSP0810 /ASSEMBLY_ACC=CAM_ASM_000659 /LENGTH=88 /DNA_ID=CAMNT_0015436055 /DNA_START=25 /DNA_END=291 /DNA_ORIENTATION=-
MADFSVDPALKRRRIEHGLPCGYQAVYSHEMYQQASMHAAAAALPTVLPNSLFHTTSFPSPTVEQQPRLEHTARHEAMHRLYHPDCHL